MYLPYVIAYIPVFYFNDLQALTVHAHALGKELPRYKNRERQSYSENVLCLALPSSSSGIGSGPMSVSIYGGSHGCSTFGTSRPHPPTYYMKT